MQTAASPVDIIPPEKMKQKVRNPRSLTSERAGELQEELSCDSGSQRRHGQIGQRRLGSQPHRATWGDRCRPSLRTSTGAR